MSSHIVNCKESDKCVEAHTNIYLIKVDIMSGTITAVAQMLAISSLVSRVKLYNVYCVQNYCSLIICKIMLLFYE